MATADHLAWIERQAFRLRQYLHLNPLAILDPLQLARKMDVVVLSPTEVPGLPMQVMDQLLKVDNSSWSAGCMILPDGKAILLFNPTHASTRLRATIMEELAHIFLKHKGSQLVKINMSVFRTYNKTEESNAYWIGAAALLPRVVLLDARNRRMSNDQLAHERGVSAQLVSFRENVTRIRLNSHRPPLA